MPTVEEPTAGREGRDFDEAEMPRVEVIDGGRKVAYARGIDELAATRELVNSGHGRGMASFLIAHQPADLGFGTGSEAVHER